MNDQILTPKHSPRRHTVRAEALNSPNTIRVYRASPEDVQLQIRLNKDFVGASLSFDEARQVAAMLVASANEGA